MRYPIRFRSAFPGHFYLLLCLFCGLILTPRLQAMPVFINELHYENIAGDVNEGVELAGLSGINLNGWRLWFYNGNSGTSYGSLALSGVFANMASGYGVLSFAYAGIQNGSPDGIALTDEHNLVQQFISYEGAFTALGGVANALLSSDIGVAESSQSAADLSLQLTGTGSDAGDFSWRLDNSSFGSINTAQLFQTRVTGEIIATDVTLLPIPSIVALCGLGWLVMGYRHRKNNP